MTVTNAKRDLLHGIAKVQILTNLRKGKANSISRQRIKEITGFEDRYNRHLIEELRDEGIPIMSNSMSNGYWLPATITDVEHYIHEFRKRGRECSAKANLAELWLQSHKTELEENR